MMKRVAIAIIVILWSGSFLTAQAQQMPHIGPEAGAEKIRPLHVTDWLDRRPEAQRALAEFHARKNAGLLPSGAGKAAMVDAPKTFKVFNFKTEALEDIVFELMATDRIGAPPRFHIWAEIAELDRARITEATINSLIQSLGETTPPGSFNPEAGIIENMEVIFGEPPNVDGDGLTDILILDIRDNYDGVSERRYVAGFVTSSDLSGRGGNDADVMYLDSYPQLACCPHNLLQTAAHEYQHLIMYNWDENEITFVNEGISEWAEIALGYPGRTITYLNSSEAYNVPLYRWSEEDRILDYQRAGMFISYFGDRFGVLNAGKITRSSAEGSDGLRDALVNMQAGVGLDEVIFDFHSANLVNDTSLHQDYGYTSAARLRLHATPGLSADGRTDDETPETRLTLQPGGVEYAQWDNVKDFSLTLSPASDTDDTRAEVLLIDGDGNFVEAAPVSTAAGSTTEYDGEFSRVLVVLADVNPDGTSETHIDIEASWETETMLSLVTITYDNGEVQRDPARFFSLRTEADGVSATRFLNPSPGREAHIDRIWLAPYFRSQFTGAAVPETAPRDLILYVWGSNGNNQPGDVLFQEAMVDPRPYASVAYSLNHFEFDFGPHMHEMGPIPDTLFIGIGEDGVDENYQVVAPATYDVEDISHIGNISSGAWGPLWSVTFVGDPDPAPLTNTVIPTRARLAVSGSVAAEDAADLPERIALEQNYPNPFNPTTRVSYYLPQAMEVRLAVYDLLGRQVAVLVNALQSSGAHIAPVNAEQWASGVYFYRLETASLALTKRMMVVK